MENNFEVVSAAVSDRGLSEKRPQNEDSYLELASQGVFAVADGVGGAQAGDVASQMAVEILGEAFANQPPEIDAEEIMRVAIDRANTAIYQMANDLPQLSSMATTIAAVHLSGNIATIGHVGDSRVYRLDRDGYLYRETHDHSVVEEEVRAGRMTPEQALNHPSRNVISRALGAEGTVDIDMKTIMVDPGTTFLLCSDGVTRHISDGELGELLAAGFAPADLCDRLKAICYERGAEDNLTAVIVKISPEVAGSYSTNGAAEHDAEDVTIASARSPFASTVLDDTPQGEVVTNTGAMSADDASVEKGYAFTPLDSQDTIPSLADELDDQSYLMSEQEDKQAEKLEGYTSESVIVPARPAGADTQPLRPKTAATVIYEDKKPAESVLSKALSTLLYLVLGALIGAGLYYLFVPKTEPVVVETPVITEVKSNNISLTAFEEGRRQVDNDPAQYINANAASPQVPEDYFLLGRAFMLTGKYWEAKRSFTEARNRLAQADKGNARTLAAEIAMALAIIESSQATETFQRDLATANAAGANTAASNTVADPNAANSAGANSNTAISDPLVPGR